LTILVCKLFAQIAADVLHYRQRRRAKDLTDTCIGQRDGEILLA
jgi:hypothetical protein